MSNKQEMIEAIETLIRANKDDDYVGFDQLGAMIKEGVADICDTPDHDESIWRRLTRGTKYEGTKYEEIEDKANE